MAAVMSPESQRVAPRTHSAVPRAHCSPVSSQRRRHSSHSCDRAVERAGQDAGRGEPGVGDQRERVAEADPLVAGERRLVPGLRGLQVPAVEGDDAEGVADVRGQVLVAVGGGERGGPVEQRRARAQVALLHREDAGPEHRPGVLARPRADRHRQVVPAPALGELPDHQPVGAQQRGQQQPLVLLARRRRTRSRGRPAGCRSRRRAGPASRSARPRPRPRPPPPPGHGSSRGAWPAARPRRPGAGQDRPGRRSARAAPRRTPASCQAAGSGGWRRCTARPTSRPGGSGSWRCPGRRPARPPRARSRPGTPKARPTAAARPGCTGRSSRRWRRAACGAGRWRCARPRGCGTGRSAG